MGLLSFVPNKLLEYNRLMENIPESNVAQTVTGVQTVARSSTRIRKKFNWNWVLIPTVFVLGIMVGCLARPLLWDSPSAANNPDQVVQLVISKTRHFKGNPNAPVTILEFSDFQ